MKRRTLYEIRFLGKTKNICIAATTMDKALTAAQKAHPKVTIDAVNRMYHSVVYIPELG